MIATRILYLVAGLGLVVGGCSTHAPSPFPRIGPLTGEKVLEVLRERSQKVDSIYAEITITYSDPDHDGTFDAVVHFLRPASLRLTAFKDVIVTVEPIFDVAFTETTYAIDLPERDGQPPTFDHGQAAAFPDRHPRFAGFFWSREAFCLPAALREGQGMRVRKDGRQWTAESRLSSGARVTWILAPDTLEVRKGIVSAPDGNRYELEYSEYMELVEGLFVARHVIFRDPDSKTTIEAYIDRVEVNTKIDASLFAPAAMGLD